MRQMYTKLLGKRVLLFVAVGLVWLFLAGCAHNGELPAVDNTNDNQQDEEMNNNADDADIDMDDADNEDADMDEGAESETGDAAQSETGDDAQSDVADADSETGDDSADDEDEELVADVVVTLEASNFTFSDETIEVNEGDVVQVVLESVEGYHDWVIDEFDAATQKVNAGGTTSVTFVADEAGSFEYYCSVGNHREQGMVGTLTVN